MPSTNAILEYLFTLVLVHLAVKAIRPLSVFVHESGHALAGWSVGLRIEEFRVTSKGGHCNFYEDARAETLLQYPLRCAWVAAGGAVANTMMAAVMAFIVPYFGISLLSGACILFGGMNVYLASLLVLHRDDPTSDGARIYQAWTAWRNGTPCQILDDDS